MPTFQPSDKEIRAAQENYLRAKPVPDPKAVQLPISEIIGNIADGYWILKTKRRPNGYVARGSFCMTAQKERLEVYRDTYKFPEDFPGDVRFTGPFFTLKEALKYRDQIAEGEVA